MIEWFGSFKDIALVADSKTILLGGLSGVALSATGLIPRIGYGRAITFGLQSFFKKAYPLSVRTLEIQQLNKSILSLEKGMYITVIGDKGNGKSCLIDTALNGQCGVVKMTVSYAMLYSPRYNNLLLFIVYRRNPVRIKTLLLTKPFGQLLGIVEIFGNYQTVLILHFTSTLFYSSVPLLWSSESLSVRQVRNMLKLLLLCEVWRMNLG